MIKKHKYIFYIASTCDSVAATKPISFPELKPNTNNTLRK